MDDVIVIGGGPCGLSAAIELGKIGLSPLIIEKNYLVSSIYAYPTNMVFFSTPELLEIGDIPFTTANEKPTRSEALAYYRKVAQHYQIRTRNYEEVTRIIPGHGHFEVHARDRFQELKKYEAASVVVAKGYFDQPNLLGIPGEDLAKVSHYFRESHPYTGMKVAIIGGNSSAIDAALELNRVGAEVTVVYRGQDYSKHIKPWVRPVFESMVNKGAIQMMFNCVVSRIEPKSLLVSTPQGTRELANDFVFALTGYRPNHAMLVEAGVKMNDTGEKPLYNPETMETNLAGLYVAGVIVSGNNANEIFIETGRFHGKLIAQQMMVAMNACKE